MLKDAHLDKLDSQGYTPLMVAAATDQEQIVNDLIRRGASMKISGPKRGRYSIPPCLQTWWSRCSFNLLETCGTAGY